MAQTLQKLSALSQETRLKTFKALMEVSPDGLSAGFIAEIMKVAPNNMSAHLNVLSQSGLITVERQGRHMIYKANIKEVNKLLSSLVADCCNGHPEVCTQLSELKCVTA